MPQLLPNDLYTREGYRITAPAILGHVAEYAIYQIILAPDCFEAESTGDVFDAFETTLHAQTGMAPMNALILLRLGGWALTYKVDSSQVNGVETFANKVFLSALITRLDRVFGFPAAFDPAQVDMSFMDEEPVDPDQPAFPID